MVRFENHTLYFTAFRREIDGFPKVSYDFPKILSFLRQYSKRDLQREFLLHFRKRMVKIETTEKEISRLSPLYGWSSKHKPTFPNMQLDSVFH